MKTIDKKSYYSVNELAERLNENVWTLRLWANRFDILKPCFDKNDNLMFSSDDAEKIETICRLSKKKGMTINRVRKYLDEGGKTAVA